MSIMEKNTKFISYFLMFICLTGLFYLHLITSLIGGISMFIIVNMMHDFIKTKIHSKTAVQITVLILALIAFGAISLLISSIYYVLSVGSNSFVNFGDSLFSILELIKTYIPINLHIYLPDDFNELKDHILEIAKKNLPNMLEISKNISKGFFHVIIGMLIGAMIAFSLITNKEEQRKTYFIKEISNRIKTFKEIFHKVVFAQVKISAINTLFTAIYLLVVLPLLDMNISQAKTLVVLTFLFGLLPVVGNLISNTLITLFSLQVSFYVAIYSLIFLVIIHKLEYYVNAKIIGGQIKTKIWEMLIVMLVFESIFGIIGAILSPVIYGYIKEEMKKEELI